MNYLILDRPTTCASTCNWLHMLPPPQDVPLRNVVRNQSQPLTFRTPTLSRSCVWIGPLKRWRVLLWRRWWATGFRWWGRWSMPLPTPHHVIQSICKRILHTRQTVAYTNPYEQCTQILKIPTHIYTQKGTKAKFSKCQNGAYTISVYPLYAHVYAKWKQKQIFAKCQMFAKCHLPTHMHTHILTADT